MATDAPSRSDVRRTPTRWTDLYDTVRELEGRHYPDEIVARLPDVPSDDPLRAEWRRRADSAERLVRHLARSPLSLKVVEVGCGNGWLSALIARSINARVVGLDLNDHEIEQASRVFAMVPGLSFVVADAEVATSPLPRPTTIVLASVIQYIADVPAFIRRLLDWLAPGGEIHVLDSPLYRRGEAAAARARSAAYYVRLGVPAMADAYHHHDIGILDGFSADALHDPGALGSRVAARLRGGRPSPFPWIRVRRAADAIPTPGDR